jgi:hypothetical protein
MKAMNNTQVAGQKSTDEKYGILTEGVFNTVQSYFNELSISTQGYYAARVRVGDIEPECLGTPNQRLCKADVESPYGTDMIDVHVAEEIEQRVGDYLAAQLDIQGLPCRVEVDLICIRKPQFH